MNEYEKLLEMIRDTELKIDIAKRDLVAHKAKLEMLSPLKPESFVLEASVRVTGDSHNLIIMKRDNGEEIVKLAWYWGWWRQLDENGCVVRIWEGPARNCQQAYPDAIKKRFITYVVNIRPEGSLEATTF